MTGRYENGQEAGRWQKWWADNSGKSEAQWRQELQAYQASRYMQMRQRYEQLTGELQSILTRAYENTPAAQQSSLLLAYLRSTDPEIRRNGAVIVADGKLIALNGDGELSIAPASPDGFKPTAKAKVLGPKCWTAPVLANGLVYCRNSRGEIVVVDLRGK